MTNEQTLKLETIAASALMLEPGASFVVPADGSREWLEDTCDAILEEVERQREAASDLLPDLAPAASIEVAIVHGRPPSIIVSRQPL